MAGKTESAGGGLFDGVAEILSSDIQRFDDLAASFGLDPAYAFVGMKMHEVEFVGTPERPFDLRGWNLTRCDLTGARFEHVVVDETTVLDEADLTDITGDGADDVLALVPASPAP